MIRSILRVAFMLLVAVAAVIGATALFAKSLPDVKHKAYADWYEDVKKCSGLVTPAAQFEDLQFVVIQPADSGGFYVVGEGPFVGWSDVWNKVIYLDSRFTLDRRIVKHEMLHQLIGRPGHGPMFDLCAY